MTGVNAAGQYVERCVPIVIALYIRTVPIHIVLRECTYVFMSCLFMRLV